MNEEHYQIILQTLKYLSTKLEPGWEGREVMGLISEIERLFNIDPTEYLGPVTEPKQLTDKEIEESWS